MLIRCPVDQTPRSFEGKETQTNLSYGLCFRGLISFWMQRLAHLLMFEICSIFAILSQWKHVPFDLGIYSFRCCVRWWISVQRKLKKMVLWPLPVFRHTKPQCLEIPDPRCLKMILEERRLLYHELRSGLFSGVCCTAWFFPLGQRILHPTTRSGARTLTRLVVVLLALWRLSCMLFGGTLFLLKLWPFLGVPSFFKRKYRPHPKPQEQLEIPCASRIAASPVKERVLNKHNQTTNKHSSKVWTWLDASQLLCNRHHSLVSSSTTHIHLVAWLL